MRPLSLTVLGAAIVWTAPLNAQLSPPSTGGIVEFDRILQQLGENRRLLVIGAHPDDEDTQLLALSARQYGARAAYLSLSRGEGGQNLIGQELGSELGLVRARELQAARMIDGAEQFFTRAYDYGFSRTLEEANRFWPPDSILKDIVRVVRSFRPHVMVSVFTGTPRDGHGQHQTAGVTALRAFETAGDPGRFPELWSEEGLEPWQPSSFHWAGWSNREAATLRLSTGGVDPRNGRSIHQIAMESRSQHRSQDMGRLQRIGPQGTSLIPVAPQGNSSTDQQDLFAGISRRTDWLTRLSDSLRREITAVNLSAAVAPLLGAKERRPEASARRRELLDRALAIAAGLSLDAVADDSDVVPGETFEVTVEAYNSGAYEMSVDGVEVSAPRGWTVARQGQNPVRIRPGESHTVSFAVRVPVGEKITQPYFLQNPRIGFLYDWRGVPAKIRSLPFDPPLIRATVHVSVYGTGSASQRRFAVSREVSYRYNDQARGEVRREVRVVPGIDVKVEPRTLLWSTNGPRTQEFVVTLANNHKDSAAGSVELTVDGWAAIPAQRYELAGGGSSRSFAFTVRRPENVTSTVVSVQAAAHGDDGGEFDRGVYTIVYPHIRPAYHVRSATAEVRVSSLTIPNMRSIGYVRGAADRVPEALQRIGVPVHILDATDLEAGDLSGYDAIVVGSRAYEIDSALTQHNNRLLEYVSNGGLLVVQYQQYQFVRGGFAPFPLDIARPHDRITDETVPVTVLQPDHPAFTFPNVIDESDWDGWPQERGLYFARSWDTRYQPLLRMSDPGQGPLEGGLLAVRYGEGTYVYSGLSFFRALPAGVPGAYRLFLNLLALNVGALP